MPDIGTFASRWRTRTKNLAMDKSLSIRVLALFAGAAIGLYIGNLLAPFWLYSDPPSGFMIELERYRSAHAAFVMGIATGCCTLIAARFVGYGIFPTVFVSTLSGFVYKLLVLVQTGQILSVPAITLVGLFYVPAYLFASSAVAGFWYMFIALRRTEDRK